ncbi:MAG: HAMP domain-containing protein [Deltaproteobacteria bacterium]|nr:HAMP domain-containing protein [Deltaproteobacteria bacterium]
MFLLVWIPLLAVTGWGAYWLWLRVDSRPAAALESLALRGDAQKLTEAATDLAASIDGFLLDRITQVQTWATSPVVIESVHEVRAAHEKQGFDDLAIPQIESRFRVRKTLGLAPAARAYLTEQVRMSPHFAEVFFTDEQGFNVALTNPTSDFVQSDETWWQQAWSSGFHVGDIEFDPSANVWSVDLSVRIHDKGTGNAIGVMKAVLPVRFVQLSADRLARRLSAPGQLLHTQVLDPAQDGRASSADRGARTSQGSEGVRTQFLVVTRNGSLIAETRSAHARGRIMQPEISLRTDASLAHLNRSYEGDRSGAFIATRRDSQNRQDDPFPSSLIGFARSASTGFYTSVIENFSGFDWMIIVEAPNLSDRTVLPELGGTGWQDQQNRGRDVLWLAVALWGALLLSSVVLCWLFGKWVLDPVRTLIQTVQRMEQGHIGDPIAVSWKGEFAELAAALDRIRNMISMMADRVRQLRTAQTQPRPPE